MGDEPFLYSPVLAAAVTGWALIISPCCMPSFFRFLDRRYRRKLGVKKSQAQKDAEELERQQEEMRLAAERDAADDQQIIQRKKRKKSVWVAPEQLIADGTKRYTVTARLDADKILSKKQQAIQRKELGMTVEGKQAPRLVPKDEDKLANALGIALPEVKEQKLE